jgi:hypothetical protein
MFDWLGLGHSKQRTLIYFLFLLAPINIRTIMDSDSRLCHESARAPMRLKHTATTLRTFSFSLSMPCIPVPVELSGIPLGYGLNDQVFETRQDMGIFFFTTMSRPALDPTQPSIQ